MTTTGATVLLVEDHVDTRIAVASWLKRRGYTIVEADNVEAAFAAAQAQPCDIMLCDLQLPDGDGWTLMSRLCTNQSIVAIAASGHGSTADIARSKAVGFLEHLIKPYSSLQMRAAFQRADHELARRKSLPEG